MEGTSTNAVENLKLRMNRLVIVENDSERENRMKSISKTVTLGLCAAVLIGLAGCGQTQKRNDNTGSSRDNNRSGTIAGSTAMGCDLYQHQQSFKRGGSEGVVVRIFR